MNILSCQWKGLGDNGEPLKHRDEVISFVAGKMDQRNE